MERTSSVTKPQSGRKKSERGEYICLFNKEKIGIPNANVVTEKNKRDSIVNQFL